MNKITHEDERILYWTLHGRLTPDNQLKHVPGILTPHPPRNPVGDFASQLRVELLDGDGRLLVSQKVPVSYYCPDKPNATRDIAINLKVPFHKDTKTIRFWNGEVLVKEWQRSNTPPVIGDVVVRRVRGQVRLTWQARHPEGKEIQFVVRFSQDGGKTFNRLSQRLDQPQYKVAETQIPGGKDWIFQIAATDGVNTTTVETKPIDLPETPPLIEISSPPDGYQVASGSRVMFHGELIAFLGEDTRINSALWTSDRDGALSDQLIFETDQLSRGAHRITLTVIDNQKRQLTSTISLQVK